MFDRQANILLEFGGKRFEESKTDSRFKVFSYFLGENEFITGIRGKRRIYKGNCFLYETEFKIERD
jgi:hypothetical protein